MSGDPDLADTMRMINPPAPRERIVQTDILATVFNRDKLGPDLCRRIVILECGHRAVTRNAKSSKCNRCHRMIMEGYDYDAFRNLKTISDPIEDDEPII